MDRVNTLPFHPLKLLSDEIPEPMADSSDDLIESRPPVDSSDDLEIQQPVELEVKANPVVDLSNVQIPLKKASNIVVDVSNVQIHNRCSPQCVIM